MISPGTSVGPYQVLDILGSGGMGQVFRARDSRLGRYVALKVVSDGSCSASDARERFRNEARLIASLNHPHICTLYDVVSHESVEYLVMEYIEGQTLANAIRNGPLPVTQALTCARDVADALVAAHNAGVLHRDLKPGNLMITSTGKVKVLDFGIAKRLEVVGDLTQTLNMADVETLTGTLPYIAPEVLRGVPADVRSDIWGFGVTFREMLTGQPLVQGRTHVELIAAILEQRFTTLSADLPKHVCGVIARCLDREPANRFRGYMRQRLTCIRHWNQIRTQHSPTMHLLRCISIRSARSWFPAK